MKILIPAYEPNEKLIKLVKEIRNLTDIQIIVINDGSGEKYNNIFEELVKMNIKILVHDRNKGKGEAIRTGIRYLIEQEETEGCVFADCDGQHTPKDIVAVQELLNKTKKNIILGVRDFNQKKIPLRSKIGNKVSKILFKIMTGIKITDTQTGLRGYSADIFEWLLQIEGNRYEYEFNILLKINEDNISYEEIKIDTIYEEKNKQSHFKPIKDSILIYKPIIKFVKSSVLAAIVDFCLLIIFQNKFNNLLIAVVLARIISSIINFICNKNYVFEKRKTRNTMKMATQYFLLVLVIMILNYCILNLLYIVLNINIVISKVITEVILYVFSFIIQKRVVFCNKQKT